MRASELRKEIVELQRGYGVTTIAASNRPDENLAMPDRLVALDHGRVVVAISGCHQVERVSIAGLGLAVGYIDVSGFADPAEMNNLINDPSRAEMRDEMKGRLLGWNGSTNDMFQWAWTRWNFPDPIDPYGKVQ